MSKRAILDNIVVQSSNDDWADYITLDGLDGWGLISEGGDLAEAGYYLTFDMDDRSYSLQISLTALVLMAAEAVTKK